METAAEPLLPPLISTQEPPSSSRPPSEKSILSLQSPWLALAAASGACAAFNGVFAKLCVSFKSFSFSPRFWTADSCRRRCKKLTEGHTLYSTTTELTSSWSSAIATTIGLSASNRFIEFLIRAVSVYFSLFLLSLSLLHLPPTT